MMEVVLERSVELARVVPFFGSFLEVEAAWESLEHLLGDFQAEEFSDWLV